MVRVPPTMGDYAMILVELSYSVWSLGPGTDLYGLGVTFQTDRLSWMIATHGAGISISHNTLWLEFGSQGTSDKQAEPEAAVYLHAPSI